MCEFIQLPDGPIVKSLELCDLPSLLNVEQTCRRLRAIVQDSSRLQYLKESFLSGRPPQDQSHTPSADLLASLRAQDHAWRSLNFRPLNSYPVDKGDSDYAGIFLARDYLHVCCTDYSPQTRIWYLEIKTMSLPFGSESSTSITIPRQMQACKWTIDTAQDLIIALGFRISGSPPAGRDPRGQYEVFVRGIYDAERRHSRARRGSFTFTVGQVDHDQMGNFTGTPGRVAIGGDHVAFRFSEISEHFLRIFDWRTGERADLLNTGYSVPPHAEPLFIKPNLLGIAHPDGIDILRYIDGAIPSFKHVMTLEHPNMSRGFSCSWIKPLSYTPPFANHPDHSTVDSTSLVTMQEQDFFGFIFYAHHVAKGNSGSFVFAVHRSFLDAQLLQLPSGLTLDDQLSGRVPSLPFQQWSRGHVHVVPRSTGSHSAAAAAGVWSISGPRVLQIQWEDCGIDPLSSSIDPSIENPVLVYLDFSKWSRRFPSPFPPMDPLGWSDEVPFLFELEIDASSFTSPPFCAFGDITRSDPTPDFPEVDYEAADIESVLFNDQYLVFVDLFHNTGAFVINTFEADG